VFEIRLGISFETWSSACSLAAMSRDHRKLRVFQQADAYVVRVYELSRALPIEERYGLQSQLRRAAVSVATNIVEGSARSTSAEFRRFLDIGHSSARETSYLLGLASRLGMLDAPASAALANNYDSLAAWLLNLSASVREPQARKSVGP
jgi:four helix bundle protein